MARGRGAQAAAGITKERQWFIAALVLLCALDVPAHSAMLPTDMNVVRVRIPNSLATQTVEESDLPSTWNAPIACKKQNYLRNSAHPDFGGIRFFPPQPFTFAGG